MTRTGTTGGRGDFLLATAAAEGVTPSDAEDLTQQVFVIACRRVTGSRKAGTRAGGCAASPCGRSRSTIVGATYVRRSVGSYNWSCKTGEGGTIARTGCGSSSGSSENPSRGGSDEREAARPVGGHGHPTQLASWLGIGSRRPDLLVRFGYGPAMPQSMRRPVEDVIEARS